MIEFIENCRSSSQYEISQSCDSPISKYRAFFKLAAFVTEERILNLKKPVFFIFNSIMASSKLNYKFETTASQRFLSHLIIQHGLILNTNSFGSEDEDSRIESLLLLTSYFNHSCLPNVAKLSRGNLSVIKTILPIKQGEQLYLSYINGEVFDMTKRERNNSLENTYGFGCTCKLCTTGRIYNDNLYNDPNFLFVSSNATNDNFVNDNVSKMIEFCIEFLLRYPDMNGSKEVAYIADILTALFSKQINS